MPDKKPDLREKDLETLRRIFARFPCIREVRLFGSRANGNAGRTSDIDLAVFAPDADDRTWARIVEAVENAPIIHEIDLVRFESTTCSSLRGKIERDVIAIAQGNLPTWLIPT